jgi:pyrimidine-nucleoside phosphorylase
MVGQGPDLAPADGALYALRDVTSTVEFEPFIVSSIVSKKIAEGARSLVYDVKCGNGAFMKTREAAGRLARRLVETTRGLGANAVALVTDMNWPLGRAVGNSLEVREACETLRGAGPADTRALTLDLAAEMIHLAGAAPTRADARANAERALDSGAAWDKWIGLIRAQGGDVRAIESIDGLASAPVKVSVPADRDGVLSACDCFALGELAVSIGGGRRAKEDAIDPRVGIVVEREPGTRIRRGDPIATIHLAQDDQGAVARARSCFLITADGESPDAGRAGRVLERVD